MLKHRPAPRLGHLVFYRENETTYRPAIVTEIHKLPADSKKERADVALAAFYGSAAHMPVFGVGRVAYGKEVGQYQYDNPNDDDEEDDEEEEDELPETPAVLEAIVNDPAPKEPAVEPTVAESQPENSEPAKEEVPDKAKKQK
jgi:hypothetical protein